jgi:hypothetical protein
MHLWHNTTVIFWLGTGTKEELCWWGTRVAIFYSFFSDRFLGFSVRPFAGFPGYSYLPNPTAAAAPAASGPEGGSAYYDYVAAVHQHQQQQQQQQQQQPPATARPEQTVNNSPLHRHHSDPHTTVYRTANTTIQRKQCSAPPPRSNQHQQMMLHSELYTSGAEDNGVKAYVTGMSQGCPLYVIIALSCCGLCHCISTSHMYCYFHRNGFVSVRSAQVSVTLQKTWQTHYNWICHSKGSLK